ncbi:beta-phosphoglucomutase [Ligilactobacillus hayakitensis DSM 18933 = JCM 14209]|uniref:Beta-phosphoglucomutase n=1 Tax=Ligilactobacillus hayakitensis DSM 18933 = JCM 14209 TaxID=1423755 RepID=A0A0R1WV04_9LACO|nr:beta-phosphoglucomutase [Ligilactobacillus hayakitensis]KRM19481.1 beta-phosphoglucomutase [Ligilactobacillus hayakitensis DSM 18933 = JCM 14209]
MQAAVFDLDGVVTDTAKFHFQAWSKLAKEEFNLDLPASFETNLKGISRTESLEAILKFGDLLDKYSKEEVQNLANKKNDYYVEAISKLTKEDILPGITKLLTDLKANGVKLAVASASKNAPFILEKLGLAHVFDAVADPAKVNAGKPAPDIFLAGAKAVGVAPNQCVGVEDAIAGVSAIKAADMVAVAVGDKDELRQADCVVPTTRNFTYQLFSDVFDRYHK